MVHIHPDLEVQADVSQIIYRQYAALGNLALHTNVHLIRARGAEVGVVGVAKLKSIAHISLDFVPSANRRSCRDILILQIGHRFGCAFRVDGAGSKWLKANLRRQIVSVNGGDGVRYRAPGTGMLNVNEPALALGWQFR